ncbi:choline sulfatase [Xylariaceae sp. FL1651]|nr:choline sulfatase [Xylariaceae sp. FL1651]
MAPDIDSIPHESNGHGPAPAGPNGTAAPNSNRLPNILFIMADQLAAPQLKMYNPESQILTPNLDALAAKSVQFDSAYCPSPLCAPSRMSLISGQLPMKIGAFDNASQIPSDVPTYAHYLRLKGYHTALAGKMHFVGDQLHGYETRLTSDIYPGDFGWAVNWDDPDRRLEWYHNASSILQAGPCVRSNQLDYDEEVMYKSTQFLYDQVREGPDSRPFCLTLSLTHPHDPYTIEEKYWNLYEGVDIALPKVKIPQKDQDAHSKRLLKVCDLWDQNFTEDQIKRARRAYYGAVSYVDDCIGRILATLKNCRLDQNTIVVFSGDHGDMLGERGLWYKMSYFESSVRVPLLISDPLRFTPHRVKENVSTLDILPTLCDLVGTKLISGLPMDGISLLPHLQGRSGHDTAIAEYTGEGTISPLMMIRRGPWKYITCPTDAPQLFNLENDPLELVNLAELANKTEGMTADEVEAKAKFEKFEMEAKARWNFEVITQAVLMSQRTRRLVWDALKVGKFDPWDYNPNENGTNKYIRSFLPLDDLERRARYPPVDMYGRETRDILLELSAMTSLGLSQEELKAVEQTRQRLSQLSSSINSLKNDVFTSNPLPNLDSLQASTDILKLNIGAILDILAQNSELFTRVAVHPSTNFPGRTQEGILLQLLRKKAEPDVEAYMDEGRKMLASLPTSHDPAASFHNTAVSHDKEKEKEFEEVWAAAREACQMRVADYAMDEEGDPFTAEERELGIENVRTGLRRTFDDESEEEDEEEEGDGDGDGSIENDGDADADIMIIDRPPPPPAPAISTQETEGTTLENIMRIATRGHFGR